VGHALGSRPATVGALTAAGTGAHPTGVLWREWLDAHPPTDLEVIDEPDAQLPAPDPVSRAIAR